MQKNAYLLAKIGAGTAENGQLRQRQGGRVGDPRGPLLRRQGGGAAPAAGGRQRGDAGLVHWALNMEYK